MVTAYSKFSSMVDWRFTFASQMRGPIPSSSATARALLQTRTSWECLSGASLLHHTHSVLRRCAGLFHPRPLLRELCYRRGGVGDGMEDQWLTSVQPITILTFVRIPFRKIFDKGCDSPYRFACLFY
jgi:hypothetical protein